MTKTEMQKNIIKHANALFMKYGYGKTTMNDIAKSMGKSKSALYHYYSSKEEIFKDVLLDIFDKAKAQLINSIQDVNSPVEKLKSYIYFRAKVLGEFAQYYTTFKYEYLEHFQIIENIRNNFDKEETKFIVSILQQGIDENIFSIENPEQLAEAFLSALKGYEYKWAIEGVNKKFKENIESLLNILLYGIYKRNKNEKNT